MLQFKVREKRTWPLCACHARHTDLVANLGNLAGRQHSLARTEQVLPSRRRVALGRELGPGFAQPQ